MTAVEQGTRPLAQRDALDGMDLTLPEVPEMHTRQRMGHTLVRGCDQWRACASRARSAPARRRTRVLNTVFCCSFTRRW